MDMSDVMGSLESKIAKNEILEKADMDFLNYGFSSRTMSYIIDEAKTTSVENAQSEISKIVHFIVESGLKTDYSGEEIESAINKQRKEILLEGLKKLSDKIITDVYNIEHERRIFDRFVLEDLLIASKIADSEKKLDCAASGEMIKSIMPEDSVAASIDMKEEEKIEDLFMDSESESAEFVFMNMFYSAYNSEEQTKKPSLHAPIYESLISYI